LFLKHVLIPLLIFHSPNSEAPWSAWEFAYYILHKQSNLVILSMAWTTQEEYRSFSREPNEEIICVFANRTGIEGNATYAGTSVVLGIKEGEVKLYGRLGRCEKKLLVVDTNNPPMAMIIQDQGRQGYSPPNTELNPQLTGTCYSRSQSAPPKTSGQS
jgi:protein N-terminal amidase